MIDEAKPLGSWKALLCFAVLLGWMPGAFGQFGMSSVRVASGLDKPVMVTSPPGDPRLFVVEKDGFIRIIPNDRLDAAPFLNLSAKIDTTGESGMLGLAFHPDFANNRLFYVCYTDDFLPGDPLIVVESYSVSTTNPNVADPNSATMVFGPVFQSSPGDINHGGCLQFDSSGYLFLSLGDGANPLWGQMGSSYRAKMVRLDIDLPFPHIPPDNPYVGNPGVLDPIWSFGLRAPWRFSFDRMTGDMYLGECGENVADEINFESQGSPGGLNYGWRCMEGLGCTGLSGCTCNGPNLTLPIEEIPLSIGICATIGGFVYRGTQIPALFGHYLYGDFCTGRIFAFKYENGAKGPTVEVTAELTPTGPGGIERITSFGEDSAGELYICDFDGDLFKIVPSCPAQVSVTNGSGVNPLCFSSLSSPVIGTTWQMQVDASGVPNTQWTRVVCRTGGAVVPLGVGELLVNNSTPLCFVSTVMGTSVMSHSHPIPNNPALVGQNWVVQGIVGSGAETFLAFCNALNVTVGCSP